MTSPDHHSGPDRYGLRQQRGHGADAAGGPGVIGGLLYATLMTLLVVPCMYDILSRRDLRKVDEEELQLLDM